MQIVGKTVLFETVIEDIAETQGYQGQVHMVTVARRFAVGTVAASKQRGSLDMLVVEMGKRTDSKVAAVCSSAAEHWEGLRMS